MNQQREVIYTRRGKALARRQIKREIFELLEEFVDDVVDKNFDDVLVDSIKEELLHNLLVEVKLEPEEFESLGKDGIETTY